jgi:hypothetical protein
LIQTLEGLTKLEETANIKLFLNARVTLTDLYDINFKATSEGNTQDRTRKRPININQLNLLKGFIGNLKNLTLDSCLIKRINNCFCGDISFVNKVDSLKNQLDSVQKYYLEIDEKPSAYLSRYYANINARLSSITREIFPLTVTNTLAADTYSYNFDTRTKQSIVPVFGYAFIGFQDGFTSFTPYTTSPTCWQE